ncbi:hypothetical protein B0T19DRAFT_471121 [Cercophora scortea]|uniref:Zonadhesin n=1 Tax=Cercophora scortea TaxID=314031 RepID=A0AAE0J484_9PEZI|nr:hypothetical protein B0T19DRAFT_471121 [Cercophora scortea]
MSIPESTSSFTTTYTTVESFTFTSQTEFVTTQTPTGPLASPPPGSSQSAEPAPTSFTVTVSSVLVSSTTKTVVSATATTIPATVIPSVGSVTITYYSTIIPTGAQVPILNPVSDVGQTQAVPVTGVVVIQGSTIAVVHTQAPTVVAVPTNQVETQVVTPVAKVGVTQVGGSVVTSLLVITPSPATQVAPINVVSTVGGSPVTVINQPSPETIVTDVGGTLRTVVQTPPPQTVVSMAGGVQTTVAVLGVPSAPAQPISYTVVSDVNGTPVTQVVVTTPVGPPYQPISYTVVNTIGGTPVTQVVVTTPAGPPNQPISYTVVSDVNGTPVTQVVVTTPAGPPYQPISYTVVETIGGTPVTEVFVTTPTGGPAFQPVSYTITTNIGGTPTVVVVTPSPTSFVTTIDGTPVTMVTTPPVTSYTTTVGGTLTTETLVTTPSGTGLITLTFVSTSGGTLSTYTSTFSPTTFVTTVSGKLTTITSTPSPTTSFSTQSKTTKTFTTTSTPTSLAPTPTSVDPAGTTVVATTKVYSWNERDIFVGTFLPPLLGVALVIPLRIIDLNAKLYQPFQTLARQGGGLGAETLTMQYSGFMTFVTPVVTLMQGHPVPFLTTVIVGLASFMVPLATETIGLKLHGFCYLSTASKQCGPALGVSPTPAHILIGLLVVVIVMLLLVLFFVRKWATGLFSNPWNIAGIAALAGNTQVRIRQNSEGAIKRAVSQKQYGLGYFETATGREEYGIILMDESGRGLQDQNDDSDGSSGFVDGSGSKGSPNYLPFLTLRYPWRIVMLLFQLGVLIFVIYYHIYYHGKVNDGGRLWQALNSSHFGVRFVSAIIGVIIAFCWQSFFISVSIMVPYQGMARRTLPAEKSILITPSTNPFSGIYSAIKQKHLFFFATSFAAILSEFLPVLLSNVPFSLTQTGIAATVCAVMSAVFLSIMIAVLVSSFFVRWPPMPVDPRSIAGAMFYVSQSHMLDDMQGLSQLESKERDRRIQELNKRYFYGVLVGGSWRRLGVDCDLGPSDNVPTAYGGNRIDEPPALHEHHDTEGLLRGQEARPETG